MAREIYIIQATYITDYTVELRFNDGTIRKVYFGDFLKNHPHPQYNKYQNSSKFKTFHLEHGNIVWGKNWDLIFPIEQLYSGVITG